MKCTALLFFLFLFFSPSILGREEPDETFLVEGQRLDYDHHQYQIFVSEEDRSVSQTLLQLPGFMRTGASNRPRNFQLRGIGDRAQFEHSHMNAIGVFYADIDLSEEASVMPIWAKEKLTVDYGPRTDAYGTKALAGLIRLDPCLGLECTGNLTQVSLEKYQTYSIKHRSHMSDEDFGDLVIAVGFLESAGHRKNHYLNKSTSSRDEKEFAVSHRIELQNIELTHHHLLLLHKNGYDAWSFNNDEKTLSDQPGLDAHQVHGHSLQYRHHLFQGSFSYTGTKQEESYDEDWGNNEYWNQVPGYQDDYDYYAQFIRRRQKVHKKFMAHLSDSWSAGFHLHRFQESQSINSYKDKALRRSTSPEILHYHIAPTLSFKKKSNSWFFDATARIERQMTEYKGVSKKNWTLWSTRFSAEKKLSRSWSLMGLAQKGYRGGGFNTNRDEQRSFGPESLYHSEVSVFYQSKKHQFIGKAFSYWYKEPQVKLSEQISPNDPNSFRYFTANGPKATSRGVEFIHSLRLDYWSFETSAGLLRTNYGDYELGGSSLAGRDLPLAPRRMGHFRVDYYPSFGSIYARLKATSSSYFSADHHFKAPGMSLVDIGAKINWRGLTIHSYISNLFNQRYPIRAFYFANEPPDWNEKLYLQYSEPLTWGVKMSHEW
jgi:iron complex outermembrane recepter protein